MAPIHVSAEHAVDAPAELVYDYLAGYREHRPQFLPAAFSGYEVEAGGTGGGTVVHYVVTAGGRTRPYRMSVSEPEPGHVLEERDLGSSLLTRYTVTAGGAGSTVRVDTTWNGAGGIGGVFERLFAPRVMQQVYADALERLNRYATGRNAP